MGLDAGEALLGFGGCSAPGGERLPEGRQQQVLLSRIDISPYMNPDPLTVQPGCSMARVYSLFRGVGLRHLCVVNDYSSRWACSRARTSCRRSQVLL